MTESILIGSMRRSGGTLLSRLLDGHPDCNVIPFEHNYVEKKLVFDWRDNLLFRFLDPEHKIRACGFGRNFDMKLLKTHPDADPEAFRHELVDLAVSARSTRGFYIPSSSLYFSRYQAQPTRRFLINHSPNLCVLPAWQLRRIFGAHRMILSVRDPRAVYCSLENKRNKKYDAAIIPKFCSEWARSVERLYFGDPNVISFRFEELLRKPEVVMRSVAAEIGIAFDDVLLEPTIVGEPIRANSSFSRSAGIDASAVDSWRSKLGNAERSKVEAHLGPLMERLGYS